MPSHNKVHCVHCKNDKTALFAYANRAVTVYITLFMKGELCAQLVNPCANLIRFCLKVGCR